MRLKFILTLFTLLVVSSCSSDDQHELVGRASPYMRIQNMMGETLRMQLHGFDKPSLVNIWATWCKPCVIEMPSLEKVGEKGDYRVIAVSNDASRIKVQDFIKEGKYKHIQFYYDAFGRESRQALDASGLPMTLLVDKDAVIQHVFFGAENWQSDDIQKILDKYKVKYD